MLAPLRLRKTRRSLISDSRGFSSIVGAVFAVLVMFSLISTVFVWSLSQNTLYNNTVTQTRQADLDRSNEKIVANVTVSRVDGNKVAVNGTLENDGSLSAQIVTLWAADANQKTYNFTSPLNITLKPGNVTTLSGSTAINVTLANVPEDSLSCWFISERGNTISKNPYFAANTGNSVIHANVTQGIGSVAMDFSAFWHYDFPSSPAQGTPLPSQSPANYTVSASKYTVFHVVLTDFDPLGQNITLNGNSSIYILGPHSSTVMWGTWKLVNVTGGKIYPSSGVLYNLYMGVPTVLYFSGDLTDLTGKQIDPNHVYPLNILLFGTKGNDDYGQNIPFVSVYLVN